MERFETEWGGKKLIIETGKLAAQANGSCVVQYGDTVVLGTAVTTGTAREGVDYFPLSVEYEERLYAAGRIKSSRFIKREGRPADEAILTGRLIDRSIRPLFPEHFTAETQVICTVLSVDQENDSDIPSLIAASTALCISNIPWEGPIGGIRVGRVNGEWVMNPTFAAREKSDIDLILAGTSDKALMIEAGAKEVPENIMLEAIMFGQKHLGRVIALINEVHAKVGKPKLEATTKPAITDTTTTTEDETRVHDEAKKFLTETINELYENIHATKRERRDMKKQLSTRLDEHLKTLEFSKELRKIGTSSVEEFIEQTVVDMILKQERRLDGRKINEVRKLDVEVGIVPRTHGSGLFSRGETQVLSTVTLGAPSVEQLIEGMEFVGKKRYFHHYNFPPYSVGEIKPLRGPGRREIGHGALAERAIEPLLPNKEEFPYTIRVVSEVLSSNGSSSMASTCCSSLALMDAGVPLKKSVAGIAMGLASDKSGNYRVLTDLQDLEDGIGGMDFKIAGTKDGITAIQLDTKTNGLSEQIVKEALEKGKAALLTIIAKMESVIPAPRAELSQYAPRILTLRINPDKIRDVIGPGGKVINAIIAATGVAIDIEDDGLVMITSVNPEAGQKALEWVNNLTREVKVGEEFQGKIVRILDFGAFAEVLPGQDGLIHISELEHSRVDKVSDVVAIGDIVPVKVIGIDDLGRINLSRKALLPRGDDKNDRNNHTSHSNKGSY